MPSRANVKPSWAGADPVPVMNPPPWIHTMTGSPDEVASGVHTSTVRQSSPCRRGLKYALNGSPSNADWGTPVPNSEVSLTPSQAAAGTGGRSRLGPNGAAAYGMPRNRTAPRSSTPVTAPVSVRTMV